MARSLGDSRAFWAAKSFGPGKPCGAHPRGRWTNSRKSSRGNRAFRNSRRASSIWKRSWKGSDVSATSPWRVIVVGGHTRSIGKTQLVCDIIRAFPKAAWIAGKITQYGHGVCAQNGENCDCAPDEHVSAIAWELHSDTGTDSARFLAAGARRSFWLRTKQGFLAEGLPLLRAALLESQEPSGNELPPLIV